MANTATDRIGPGDACRTIPFRGEGTATTPRRGCPATAVLASAPQTLAGRCAATADLQGTLSPPTLRTTGSGTADDLRLGGVPVGHRNFAGKAMPTKWITKSMAKFLPAGCISMVRSPAGQAGSESNARG